MNFFQIPQSQNINIMEKKAVFRENGQVYFELWRTSDGILCADWRGENLSLEEVKTGAELVLKALEETPTARFFNDNSQLTGSWDEANDWIAQVFMPAAIGLGLRRMGHVLSKDLYTELSAEFMAENAEATAPSPDVFQIRLFKEGDKAMEWLRQQLA